MRIAITGPTGFIGSALVAAAQAAGHAVVPVPRDRTGDPAAYARCDLAVHTAGLAHRTGRTEPGEAEFARVNRDLALAVAVAANAAGVRRLIHLSSIGVLTGNRGILRPDLPLAPVSAYGRSKAGAEEALALACAAAGMSLVIVRPPSVYGAGAKGNMALLSRLCATGLPLPFASVQSRSSLLGITNLVHALLFLAEHPAPPAIVHPRDGRDLTLAEIVTEVRAGMGRPAKLVPCPPWLLRAGLSLAGRGALADRLLEDLRMEDPALQALGWQPPSEPQLDLRAMGLACANQPRSLR